MNPSVHLDETADRLARRPWPTTPLRPDTRVSFEFFPAATAAGADKLAEAAQRLARLNPAFMSVTYGAGGSTQDRTQQTIERTIAETGAPVAGHLTCVGASREEVHAVVDEYVAAGVGHIVALRGDPPEGESDGTHQRGYRSAADLVAGLRGRSDADALQISVAAYPETHPRADSVSSDLDNLKAKIDAGADQAITQFFFDTDVFLRFLDRARQAGITAPIVPGIMPVANFANICRFAERCGTTVPTWMHELFADLDDAPDVRRMVAATVAAEQCRRLAEHGITDFHIYTMNNAELPEAICRILGVRPTAISADHAARASAS